MALDTRGFFVDNTPNQSLFQIGETLQQNKRYKDQLAYRKEKDEESEDWKKLNLISELTDLSKHQTSSDVANAVGNKKAAELLQKYTAEAKKMSPAELQAKISQDMSGVIGGMDAMKNELDISDATLKLLKQQHPELNVAELAKVHRADILKRRIDDNMNFVNPMTVPPPSMDLSDPDFLSDFITGNKTLVTLIVDPKGTEQESVLMGRQGDYTKFEGKLPFWKVPNYDRTSFNEEGFYTGKEIPSFKIKSSAIPSDALPSSSGKPFEVVDKDVYERFAQDSNANLELIAATKKTFPDYSKFNQQEKEYAKRNVLLNQLKAYDQSQLHPTSNVRPQRTSVNVSTGSRTQPLNLNNYPKVGDEYDITKLLQGVNVVNKDGVKNLTASKVLYNPDSKTVTFTDVAGDTETVDFDTFRQNIATINTGIDLKQVDRLPLSGRPAASNTAKPTTSSGMVTVVLKDGRKGQIPSDKVEAFLKDNPGAKKQ